MEDLCDLVIGPFDLFLRGGFFNVQDTIIIGSGEPGKGIFNPFYKGRICFYLRLIDNFLPLFIFSQCFFLDFNDIKRLGKLADYIRTRTIDEGKDFFVFVIEAYILE